MLARSALALVRAGACHASASRAGGGWSQQDTARCRENDAKNAEWADALEEVGCVTAMNVVAFGKDVPAEIDADEAVTAGL